MKMACVAKLDLSFFGASFSRIEWVSSSRSSCQCGFSYLKVQFYRNGAVVRSHNFRVNFGLLNLIFQ